MESTKNRERKSRPKTATSRTKSSKSTSPSPPEAKSRTHHKSKSKKATLPGNDPPTVSEEEYLNLPICIHEAILGISVRKQIAQMQYCSLEAAAQKYSTEQAPATGLTTRAIDLDRAQSLALQITLLTPKPFDLVLPLTCCFRRKYFSSLERLHIAYSSSLHQSPSPRAPSANDSVNARRPSHKSRSPRPNINLSPSRHSPSPYALEQRPDYARVNSSQASFGDVLATQAKAQWFMTLPEKLRSQLFSREEQERLFVALEPYYNRHSESTEKSKSRSSPSHRKTSSPYKASPTQHHVEDKPTKQKHKKKPGENSMDNSSRGRPQERGTVRRRTTVKRPESQQGGLNHSQQWTSTTPSPVPRSPMFPSHRRNVSHATMMSVGMRQSSDTMGPGIDPEAVYYRNPEARHKLRQYLASPQKFDEALTYGFPSNPQPDKSIPQTPKLPYSTGHNDAKAFLNHDMISFIDNTTEIVDPDLEEAYDTSDNGTESPATPADTSFSWRASKYNRVSIFGSLNTESVPSLDLKFQPELLAPQIGTGPQYIDPLLNREMTLRMTLTRPDLRANEDELFGWRQSMPYDPLALEDLPSPVYDTSGAQGAFAVPEKIKRRDSKLTVSASKMGFSGLFRKLRKK
ncbi:hypothetical protein BT63DRAFT_462749 [Microthyrium microscopicum]|uniref:Uncharacterized protein n=1 Tax=Microthyrium microscopicum TaxID=703497 RepID=A0A6A6USU7_9PEZI|nr:hypothetical protein BT63DRAFT_462749 [Microthyrium microscopicum]